MKVIYSILGTIIVGLVLFVIYIYSGTYNIGADAPHNGLTLWVIHTTTDNSVEHHASEIKVPNLNDSAMVRVGFQHYRAMCKGCHGAPGINRSETAMSMYPHPPKLVNSAKEMPAAEMFWVTKHGLKMTAMPAFGKTHSDQKIWDLVAFMKTKLASMSYADWVKMDTTIAPDHDND